MESSPAPFAFERGHSRPIRSLRPAVARALRDRYHVIAPDLRGHGDSSWAIGGSYTRLEDVLDITQLIETLELYPVTVISHSMGAAVALEYASICPERVHKLVARRARPAA